MNLGIRKIYFYLIILFFTCNSLLADNKITTVPIIDLEQLPATFEEEEDSLEKDIENKQLIKKSKKKKGTKKTNEIFVNLKALDKITAKTSSIKIAIGKKKYFGKLEIKPLKCAISDVTESPDVTAYLQVRDLSKKDNNQVFLFNGWTFASSPTLKSIDHPIYDLWLVGCENI